MTSLLDVVIVSYQTRDLLRDCLRALATQDDVEWRAIVVDNASTDGSARMVREEFPAALLIENAENLGFAGGSNRGLAASDAPYVMLLNSDALVQPGCLGLLYAKLELEPGIGLLAARLLNPDGTPQPSCVPDRFPWVFSSPDRDCDLVWASACALVVRRWCLEKIGPLDEQFGHTGEDYDWGLRARKANWRVALCAEAEVIHLGAATSAKVPDRAAEGLHFGRQHFYSKHFGLPGLLYARAHSTVELLGDVLRGPAGRRAFYLGLLRRTLVYRPRARRG
ncbi:MAG: glycosyltransferase family 2 protein [Candidatus Sericytochromatia bacterium]|nr:glycosyltransferase family 2 protein [Candidatus Tanganyikabacteria bacterium]